MAQLFVSRKSWIHSRMAGAEDPFVKGAFMCFGPGQFSSYLDDCAKMEVGGHLHFAGEASRSVNPAWVVGSLNGACCTERIHCINELMARWGTADELDIKLDF